tara:strand:+ start:780 stop:1772 length:993 start_codon:yes stop_codon:yes gene_type:complete
MAFELGTAIDLADLISKLSTFSVANGWTEDRRDNVNGIFALSKGQVFVSFRWDPSSPNALSIHQATAVLPGAGTEPGDATGDSGNGYNTNSSHADTSLDNERHVLLGNGPFPSYHFFEQDSGPAHIYIAAESTTDVFQHFGFGTLKKVGDDWVGGEFAFGQRAVNAAAASSTSTAWLLDGVFTSTSTYSATVRMTGLPNQPAGSVWGNVWGSVGGTPADDTAGNDKATVQGGFRAGPLTGPWGLFSGSKTTGYIPMYSISCFFVDKVSNFVYLMGWMPNVRGVNIASFANKEEVVIGSDTWIMFPAQQRSTVTNDTTTGSMGIAYKKVTA